MHKDLRNPHYVAWRRFLAEADDWSAARVAAYQLDALRDVVRLAYEGTPGYRRLFQAAGVSPETLRSLDDLDRFPCVGKEQLRDGLAEFTVPGTDHAYVTTGGSTGIPLGLYRNPEAFPRELASKAHQYARIGWREGDAQLVLRGLVIDSPDHMEFVEEFNEYRCSSYHLTPEHMERYFRLMETCRPKWLRCYPSHGTLFARFLKESGLRPPPLAGILCASENLYDFQKQLLAEVFGTRVFSHYGHYELAALAGFCEHADTYHVLPQYGYVELLDAQGRAVVEPGRTGEIVATSFLMRATPLIRYRTQDFAVLAGQGCPACGRPYQIWRRVEGRLQEFILTGTGRRITMTALNMHDDVFDHIRQFQFHQKEPGRLTFRYIAKPDCTPEVVARMRARLLAKLGDDMALDMAAVETIPLTRRNKHRFLIQELPVEYHDA